MRRRDRKTNGRTDGQVPDRYITLSARRCPRNKKRYANALRGRKKSLLYSVVYRQVPFHPFVDDQPKSVIILTYQRSGSSFFGQMLNSNPSVFYMFEPLDALYSAVYGTSQGWNVPSDITTFRNGSQRSVFTLKVRLHRMRCVALQRRAAC